jgi:hypothetical protein
MGIAMTKKENQVKGIQGSRENRENVENRGAHTGTASGPAVSGSPPTAPRLHSDEAETEPGMGRLRISVFAGRYYEDRKWERLADVEEAAHLAADRGADLLVLALYSFGLVFHPEGTAQDLVDRMGLAILAEPDPRPKPNCEYPTTLYRPRSARTPLLDQQFASGEEANKNPRKVREVLDALEREEGEEGERRFVLGGVRVGVLLCGENNILTNPNRGPAAQRYPDMGWPWSYDVLLNPSHTRMGNWNLLGPRFEYFSQGGRTAIYCTNNGNDAHWPGKAWTSALSIYQDGRRIASGEGALSGHEAEVQMDVAPSGEWRMLTVDVDRARI